VDAGTDCNDADPLSGPAGVEVCDGNDNDCDMVVPANEIDDDGDNYVECAGWNDTQGDDPTILGGDDCDDADATSNPGAAEVCDGNDNDCDTVIPADESDVDGDLYVACTGWVDTQGDDPTIIDGDDCDDGDAASNPGAAEVCDGNDNDCDTVIPADETDDDGDFYVECTPWIDTQGDDPTILDGGDCNDGDPLLFPGMGCPTPSSTPPAPTSLMFDGTMLGWDEVEGAVNYHLYRGDLAALIDSGEYTQDPGATAGAARFCMLAQAQQEDPFVPAGGQVLFYVVTADNGAVEGGLGVDSNGNARPNDHSCR